MSGDDLKSAEKRAADAAMEKENMRVAMTATEQKAISTTYVTLTTLANNAADTMSLADLRRGIHFAFAVQYANNDIQDAMRQVQGHESGIHTSPDTLRRRANDNILRVHELRKPLEVLLRQSKPRFPLLSFTEFTGNGTAGHGASAFLEFAERIKVAF